MQWSSVKVNDMEGMIDFRQLFLNVPSITLNAVLRAKGHKYAMVSYSLSVNVSYAFVAFFI